VNNWLFAYDDYEPEQEGLREALCTVGNGYFATRGAAPESSADGVHYPGTYLAGGYNRLTTRIDGHLIENEDLVNLPNWLPLTFRIEGGDWFDLGRVEVLSYRQELDLQQGILSRTIRFRDGNGRTSTLSSRRFVHMRHAHIAGLETTLTPEDWSGRVEFRSALDGRVVNAGVKRYSMLSNRHLEPLGTDTIGEDTIRLRTLTNQSHIEIATAARTRLFVDGEPATPERKTTHAPDHVAQEFACDVAAGEKATVEKVVALFTSRDHAVSECGLESRREIEYADGFEELLRRHVVAWSNLWRRVDLEVTDSERTTLILRLHIFHLLQTVSPHTIDLDVGVPARGWHGEAYRGHIFWDELFIFPFLNYRFPELTRALILYRYRRLPEARRAAKEAGYRGAMYPWQGGSDGREESQKLHLNPRSGRWLPDVSHVQRHINSAIVYKIWEYYQVTNDREFLCFYGAEMIIEVARFWASIATYNADLDRYEILGVMGPDEYHAYTNVMAAWVFCRALEVLNTMPEQCCRELCENLDLEPQEMDRWDEMSRKMRVVFHDDGIISQFEGYDRLDEFDWEGYRKKYGNIQRLDRILEAEGDTPNRYKASKQADVLMLFYLFSADELRELFNRLGYPFEYDTIPKNVRYYWRRTAHGSTLSRVVHSWVLARSDRPASWKLFTEALESDIADIQGGTTQEGIHLGAMAGTVDLMQRGYTGMEARGDVLWFNPSLPDETKCLCYRLRYRRHWVDVEITGDRLKVSACVGTPEPIKVGLKEKVYELKPGDSREFAL
jgi:alpha,alpha-trehalase